MTRADVDWETVYAAIRDDFGFERVADERARDVFDALLAERCHPDRLSVLADVAVAVVAPGPPLAAALDERGGADGLAVAESVVAVSDAARALRERGLDIDCHVTDLDGSPALARNLADEGIPVVVHGHGDNVPALRRHVPQFRQDRLYPTAQVPASGFVDRPGGFTDGDRAAVLAHRFGASELHLVGWDLADPSVGSIKRRKLQWAARILAWLERRRGEAYDALEGLRASLAPLPGE